MVGMHNGRVVLTREWAQGIRKSILRFPAGFVEEGETPKQTALREMLEETGFAATGLRKISTTYPSPQNVFMPVHIFIAKKLEKKKAHEEKTEDITLVFKTKKELDVIAENGGLPSSDDAAAWLIARRFFK